MAVTILIRNVFNELITNKIHTLLILHCYNLNSYSPEWNVEYSIKYAYTMNNKRDELI